LRTSSDPLSSGIMRLGQDVLSNPARTTAVEWLLANGIGGSSSGTVAGTLTRSTQGLLVAGAGDRAMVLLLRLDERVSGEAGAFDLACAPAGSISTTGARGRAQGQARLEEFRLDPWPVWVWNAAGTLIEKTVFVISGHDAVAVVYCHLAGPAVHLAASPVCVARALDAPPRAQARLTGAIQGVPGRVRIELAPEAPALTLWHNGTFLPARVWVRGLNDPAGPAGVPVGAAAEAPTTSRDDALVPGHAEGLLAPGRSFHLVFAAEDALFRALAAEERLGVPPPKTLADCVAALDRGERERLARWRRVAVDGADFTARQAAAAHGGPAAETARRREPLVDEHDPVAVRLATALRAGLARRGHRRTFVASLPRAQERGAEALQAVQALVSLRGFDLAREILRGYVEYLDEGLAPESFDPADGRPRYGSPAPALWLVAAADLYTRRSADGAFLAEVLDPALEGVMQALRQGTRHGVRTAADGLLVSGAAGAAAGTGSSGEAATLKRADLNALWYHALVAMAQLSRLLSHKEHAAFYLAWAREHQKRFHEVFWDAERGCLYEALTEGEPVRGLSPSQLLAVSLPPALLSPEQSAALVATMERELLTPWGLRESPGSERISTAWLGALVTAYLRVHQRTAESQARARGWIEAVLSAGCVAGQVPGVLLVPVDQGPAPQPGPGPADGGDPGWPHGERTPVPLEPASTLAAAELLRVWIEELDRGPTVESKHAAGSP
jgi:hypothetical protein